MKTFFFLLMISTCAFPQTNSMKKEFKESSSNELGPFAKVVELKKKLAEGFEAQCRQRFSKREDIEACIVEEHKSFMDKAIAADQASPSPMGIPKGPAHDVKLSGCVMSDDELSIDCGERVYVLSSGVVNAERMNSKMDLRDNHPKREESQPKAKKE